MPRPRLQTIDLAANIIAIATFALIVVRALTTVDTNWDTLQYHWAFAARAAGLCDAQCFAFDPNLEQRYLAFPMLFHTAFGALWRAFGTPAAGHAATITVVVGLCVYLWRRFAVPLAWSWLGLLAVPLVQIHLSASYVDLAANAALTLGILGLLRIVMAPTEPPTADLLVAWIGLTICAGSKLQLVPLAALVWVAIIVAVVRAERRQLHRVPWFFVLGLAALGVTSLLSQFIFNMWHFHNPVYPIAIRVAGVRLPGNETLKSIQQSMSVSTQWIEFPSWVRWFASVLEFDAFRGRILPWTVDQADVLRSSPSFRMGGYFCVYVLGLVAIVLLRSRERNVRPLLAILVAATVVCALLPNSHELRYYQFWMLTLVSVVLSLAFTPALASPSQPATLAWTRPLILLALAGVMLMTGARYMMTDGMTIEQLVAPADAIVDALPADATLCFANRNRAAILYAPVFHTHPAYHVRSIWGMDAPGCDKVINPP
jgi:hypothetical protein